jgi:flavin-dependent dehydrogenase
MEWNDAYDVAIVGGGLAGLAAALLLKKQGHSVILFEKETYPFHKVCGEYISLESWGFLKRLGMPLEEMKLPIIDTLLLTAPDGRSFTTKLPLGGFGISRYKLDQLLAEQAKAAGVRVIDDTRIEQVQFQDRFILHFKTKTVTARVCCAAYGKRSNLDIKWGRDFLRAADKRLDNYVGVKYHVKTDWKDHVIGLHNFKNGYGGISKIEEDKYCLCYMVKAESLKRSNNSIRQLEEEALYKNPHLKKIFSGSEICASFPVTISQINFNKKTRVENHVLMLGDAAGMITPLCGNGMSIALHTGKIAAGLMDRFLHNSLSREQMEACYSREWKQQFSRRLRTGRLLQRFFGSSRLSNFFVQAFTTLPWLSKPLIRMTHGKPF